MFQERYCLVEGCYTPHTHTTPGHRCPHCGKYGHGGLECGIPHKMNMLPKRTDGYWKYDIRESIRMPYDKQCTIPRCQHKWSHSTEYHHCSKCGLPHHSSDCVISTDVEWNIKYDLNREIIPYECVKQDLEEYNNIYIFFCDLNNNLRAIRKKDGILSIIKMSLNSWANPDHTIIFNRFINELHSMTPDILPSILDNIYVIDVFGAVLETSDDEEDELNEDEIKCPVCRTINIKDEIKSIKGSGDKCSICYENPVQHYFPNCEHACVCSICYNRL